MKCRVRKGHEIPIDKLTAYLTAHIVSFAAPIVEISQFEGGQVFTIRIKKYKTNFCYQSNPTYFIKDSKNICYVLRKKPPGKLLASAHQVEREYRIMTSLKNTKVPVPHCYCICNDPDVIGTQFFVMEHINGRVIRDPSLPDFTPRERTAMYHSIITVLAELHSKSKSKCYVTLYLYTI